MREYRRQILERDFETARKEFMKQINEIHSLLADDATELSHLQSERGKLVVRMDDFTSAYEVFYNTFEIEEETLALNNHYDVLSLKNHEALLLLNEKISALQAQRDDRAQLIHQEANNRVLPDSRGHLRNPARNFKGGLR